MASKANPIIPIIRPTKAELLAARDKTLPDLIIPNLRVIFCGINPGLYTAAVQRHFARPGNRFWPALHAGGFTPRVLSPFEERELLPMGWGIINFVDRATATADELSAEEFVAGAKKLERTVRKFRPGIVAMLGMGAYRVGFGRPRAALGLQTETIGDTRIWVLPNPSGLNAHYQPRDLARVFGDLRKAADEIRTGTS